jgi:hypothetical protein
MQRLLTQELRKTAKPAYVLNDRELLCIALGANGHHLREVWGYREIERAGWR